MLFTHCIVGGAPGCVWPADPSGLVVPSMSPGNTSWIHIWNDGVIGQPRTALYQIVAFASAPGPFWMAVGFDGGSGQRRLMTSIDFGLSWTDISTAPGLPNLVTNPPYDIAYSPEQQRWIVYCGTPTMRFYESEDFGASWTGGLSRSPVNTPSRQLVISCTRTLETFEQPTNRFLVVHDRSDPATWNLLTSEYMIPTAFEPRALNSQVVNGTRYLLVPGVRSAFPSTFQEVYYATDLDTPNWAMRQIGNSATHELRAVVFGSGRWIFAATNQVYHTGAAPDPTLITATPLSTTAYPISQRHLIAAMPGYGSNGGAIIVIGSNSGSAPYSIYATENGVNWTLLNTTNLFVDQLGTVFTQAFPYW